MFSNCVTRGYRKQIIYRVWYRGRNIARRCAPIKLNSATESAVNRVAECISLDCFGPSVKSCLEFSCRSHDTGPEKGRITLRFTETIMDLRRLLGIPRCPRGKLSNDRETRHCPGTSASKYGNTDKRILTSTGSSPPIERK